MGMELERLDGKVVDTLKDGVTFTLITVQLASASLSMLKLSRAVRGAYNYVESCAQRVLNIAETAGRLDVDPAVIAAHVDAAAAARKVLADAEDLATEAEEMASDFQAAKDGHEADYGPVHEAMTTKQGQIADRTYYSNR
ncbi:hypothetical protein [Streptomyces chrestomyceticus]|uniref:hypothetical protein n=1 Tax=Streptomyces chrestomyceticus TaxID=68185 RepID=UPI0033D3FDD7